MGKKSKNETAPMDTPMTPLIDFSDPCLRTFLPVLLQDHTTGKNIIWATDPPPELGVGFADEITLEQLDKVQLVPRVQKRLADQKKRTSKKAEVFTPTWVCKKMTDVAENDLKGETYKSNPWFFMAAGNYLIVGLIAEDGQKTIYVARQYYEIVNIPGEGWLREPDAKCLF